ncbi:MAG: ferritin-like domain-containing protein [Anaerolineae bacterium]
MASKAEIIEMLKEDMRDEHGAVILYLQHAYFMGESGEACEIEATARDEMRHFKWLAQAIVQLGGEPNVERTEMDLGGTTAVEWMARDVRAEEDAIAKYERHHAAIDDAKVQALIERILTDERAHREVFAGFREEFASASPGGIASATIPSGQVPEKVVSVVDFGTRHEYTVILQYLLHSFLTPDYEASREFETIAINEMQHMGWFAEYAAESGHAPLMAHDPVDASPRTAKMLQADLDAERAVSAAYSQQLQELGGDPSTSELREVIERARGNEDWHAHMFAMMLGRVMAREQPYGRPGIGPSQPSEEAKGPMQPGERKFTVGSLIE